MGVSKMVGLENHGKSQLSLFEKGRFHGAEGDSMTKNSDHMTPKMMRYLEWQMFFCFFSWVRPW